MLIPSISNAPAAGAQPAATAVSVRPGASDPIQTAAPVPRPSAEEVTAAPVREPTAPSPQDLQKMLAEAQTLLTSRAANLEFSLDDETGKTVVRVVDKETQEVIRQFPSEEMLAVARNLQRIQGFLLEDRA